MEKNNTGKVSGAINTHLTDTIEHSSESMKNNYDRSVVINIICIIVSLKGLLTACRYLLIYLSFGNTSYKVRYTSNKCKYTFNKVRYTFNIGREMQMRTEESTGMFRNSPGNSGDILGSVIEFTKMLSSLSKVLRSISGIVRIIPQVLIDFPDNFRNFPGPVREFPGSLLQFPDERRKFPRLNYGFLRINVRLSEVFRIFPG